MLYNIFVRKIIKTRLKYFSASFGKLGLPFYKYFWTLTPQQIIIYLYMAILNVNIAGNITRSSIINTLPDSPAF